MIFRNLCWALGPLLLWSCHPATNFNERQQAGLVSPPSPSQSSSVPLSSSGLGEPQDAMPGPELASQNAFLTNGFVLREISYLNPNSVPIRLQVQASGALTYSSRLKCAHPNGTIFTTDVFGLVVDQIDIFKNGKSMDSFAATGGSIEVEPNQEIEIHLLTHAAPGTAMCIFPAPVGNWPAPDVPFVFHSAFLNGVIHWNFSVSRVSETSPLILSEGDKTFNQGTPSWQVEQNDLPRGCSGPYRMEFNQSQGWCESGGVCWKG